MDIFIFETDCSKNIEDSLLFSFQNKKISNEKILKIHCLAYLMLDRILKNIYNLEDRTIVFEDGKPFLKNKTLYISISHSGEYIAIAVSKYNCGVDIEKNKKRNYIGISERMNFKADNLNDFYLEWTKYEADYKLGEPVQSYKQFQLENYSVTASSSVQNETFEIYIQNRNNFPNLLI